MSVCKWIKQAVCKTVPLRFTGSNPVRHTNMAPSTNWSKSPRFHRGVSSSSLLGVTIAPERVQICRGRLTVGQRTANPSRGKTALTTKCQSNPRLRVRISLSAPYACVSEWLMELVQKTSGQKWPVGSNPTTCATRSLQSLRLFVDFGDFFLFDATIRGIMATENSK